MRIAITGATGLVGLQVARAAVERGHDVVAITRRRPGRPMSAREAADEYVPLNTEGTTLSTLVPSAQVVRAELTSRAALRGALDGTDALIHCAAVYAYGAGHAAELTNTNVETTRTVVHAAADAGLRRVVVTSSAVTCGSSPTPHPRDETDRPGSEPTPAYNASKDAQEDAALEAGEQSGIPVILALPTVVLGGPFARLGPSNAIVLRYLLDPARSTFPGGCNVVDARDVGAGHVILLERGEAGERYLLGGENLTWRALHTLVADLAGLPGPFVEMPAGPVWLASAAAEGWARLTGSEPVATREEATTIGRFHWYTSAKANGLGHTARPARGAVAASLAHLVASPHLARWARDGLRLRPEVRAARPLVPRALTATTDPPGPGDLAVSPELRPPRPPRRTRPLRHR